MGQLYTENLKNESSYMRTDLNRLIAQYYSSTASKAEMYVRYWTRDVLYRRAFESSCGTEGRQISLNHKALRESVIEKIFPKADIPRAPVGSSRLPGMVGGHVLNILNDDISSNKARMKILHSRVMEESSSPCELDLG